MMDSSQILICFLLPLVLTKFVRRIRIINLIISLDLNQIRDKLALCPQIGDMHPTWPENPKIQIRNKVANILRISQKTLAIIITKMKFL